MCDEMDDFLDLNIMSLKEYLLKYSHHQCIIIPWKYHETVTIEDVAFISLGKQIYYLDNEYNEYIEYRSKYSERYLASISIKKDFTNVHINCLLISVIKYKAQNRIYPIQIKDQERNICTIDQQILGSAWGFIHDHPIGYDMFKNVIISFDYNHEIIREQILYYDIFIKPDNDI